MNPSNPTLDSLRVALRDEIAKNGGDASVAAFAIGAHYTRQNAFDRATIADVCDVHGFAAAGKRARDITPERALAEAVRARAAVLCSNAGRAESTQQDTYTFAVQALEPDASNKHLRAWGVYRERRLPGERSGIRDAMGARFFVSPAGIYATKPLDEHGALAPEDPACAAIAQEIVAHAQVLLATLDNTLMSRVLDAVYDQAGAFTWLCAGSKIVLPGRRADDLVGCALALKARGVPVTVAPLFRGGLTEQGVTESLVRDLSRVLDDSAKQLRDDAASGKLRASTFVKRRDELQAQVDRVKEYRYLLQGWDESLAGRLDSLRRAYDTASEGALSLTLPDWVEQIPPSAPDAAPESAPPASEPADEPEPDAADPFAI